MPHHPDGVDPGRESSARPLSFPTGARLRESLVRMDSTANTETTGPSPVPGVGEVIEGKYRVEEVVGRGGMGVVLAARHLTLGQRVAIKVLSAADAARAEATARFLREGRAAAGLTSDHVVRIHDVGTLPSGAPFMVMELLRGKDLSAHLSAVGPLPIPEAVDFVLQTCDAIAEAHALGIVHRDLKPSNLFLTHRSDGAPLIKVLDFGISKTRPDADDPSFQATLTSTRSVIGSPAYMAPEQIRDARHVDARVDVWSLGLILYELLSGEQAFVADTLPAVCAAIAADDPTPLRQIRPEVPPALEAVIQRCLEKDPARRFQSVCDLGDALAPFGRHHVELKRCPPTESLVRQGAPIVARRSGASAPSDPREEALRSGERDRLLSPTSAATLASPTGHEGAALGREPRRPRATQKVMVALILAALAVSVILGRYREPPPEPGVTAGAPTVAATTATPTATARSEAPRPPPEVTPVPPTPSPSIAPAAATVHRPAASTAPLTPKQPRPSPAAPPARGRADAGPSRALDIRLER